MASIPVGDTNLSLQMRRKDTEDVTLGNEHKSTRIDGERKCEPRQIDVSVHVPAKNSERLILGL